MDPKRPRFNNNSGYSYGGPPAGYGPGSGMPPRGYHPGPFNRPPSIYQAFYSGDQFGSPQGGDNFRGHFGSRPRGFHHRPRQPFGGGGGGPPFTHNPPHHSRPYRQNQGYFPSNEANVKDPNRFFKPSMLDDPWANCQPVRVADVNGKKTDLVDSV